MQQTLPTLWINKQEKIHDYDYYVVNYPISFSTAPPDWGGLDDYFGRLED